MRLRAALVVLFALLLAPVAFAAPCGGFTDVDDANPAHAPFCDSVEWMKNRGITLGCAATLYCPGDPVSRLAMAAFISRLDRVLPPTVVDAIGVAFGPLVTFTGTLAQTYYRLGANAYSVLLVNTVPNSAPPNYNLAHTFAFYALPNCDGAGAVYMNTAFVVDIVGKPGLVVRGPAGARYLFTTATYPIPLSTVFTQSYLQGGVCTNAAQTIGAYQVTLVEDLAAKFSEPFTVE